MEYLFKYLYFIKLNFWFYIINTPKLLIKQLNFFTSYLLQIQILDNCFTQTISLLIII